MLPWWSPPPSSSDSVVVSVSVDDDSVDVVSESVVVASVDVESDSTASGPAPATTLDVTSPAANIITSTNVTRRSDDCAATRLFDLLPSPHPLLFAPPQAASPRRTRIFAAFDTKSTAAAVLTCPPEQLGVRCYNPAPADGESALFL